MAAITILATEAPHFLKEMFVTKGIQETGKYVLKLHCHDDVIKQVEMDDYFPCYVHTVPSFFSLPHSHIYKIE